MTDTFFRPRSMHSKLDEIDVLRIRRLADQGITRRVLARLYGVSLTTVNHIVYRYRWNWIPPIEKIPPDVLVGFFNTSISRWKRGVLNSQSPLKPSQDPDLDV